MLAQGCVCTKVQNNTLRRMEVNGADELWLSMKPVPRFLRRDADSITAVLATQRLHPSCPGPATGTHNYRGAALALSGIWLASHRALRGPRTSVQQDPRVFPVPAAWCPARGRRSPPEEPGKLRQGKVGIGAPVSGPWRRSAASAPPGLPGPRSPRPTCCEAPGSGWGKPARGRGGGG